MILADKIMTLRKKAGWSQEELAAQLGVTRQSVSKWEGAQSIPDMDKVVQMSRLFGVTTDYLLKDELEEAAPAPAMEEADGALRRVTMEQASAYLSLRRQDAPKMALAASLCVLSPIPLIALAGLSELPASPISENAAAGLGLCFLVCMVAAAVYLFLRCSARARDYAFLEDEPFETEYGVAAMVKERRREYADTFSRLCILGTVLCILSTLPLFISLCFEAADMVYLLCVCVLLALVSGGCYAFVLGGTIHSAANKLLEKGDYTRSRKAGHGLRSAISLAYWLVVTAVFLLYIFGPSANPQYSWIVWAVGGVLYAAVMSIVGLIGRKKPKQGVCNGTGF